MKEKHKLADIPQYHPNPACRIKYFGMIFQIDMGYGHINSQDSVKEISYRHAVCVCASPCFLSFRGASINFL